MLELDPARTAVVFIDLQKGILAMPIAPHDAASVVAVSLRLGAVARETGALLVLVNVDGVNLRQPVDASPPQGIRPADWAEIVPPVAALGADLYITKHQWGAFFGTELDLQLRRRGIDTIVLSGIATNFGVEQTAREAWQLNYSVVIAEDATSAIAEDMHRFSIDRVLPRVSRIRQSVEIMNALRGAAVTVAPSSQGEA